MFWDFSHWIGGGILCLALSAAVAQSAEDSVRITVTMNPDGSKTVYQLDGAKKESVATTTDAKGKRLGKMVYKLDDEDRYETGQVFGPDGKLRFKTAYRYDAAGRLTEEQHLGNDGMLHNKLVYKLRRRGPSNGLRDL